MLTLKPNKKLTFDRVTDTLTLSIVIDGGEHIAKSFEDTKQDENFVYAEYKNKTYKIPQIRDN